MNPYAIGIAFILLCVVVIGYLYESHNDGRKEMLEELYKKNKISEDTYKEYLD